MGDGWLIHLVPIQTPTDRMDLPKLHPDKNAGDPEGTVTPPVASPVPATTISAASPPDATGESDQNDISEIAITSDDK